VIIHNFTFPLVLFEKFCQNFKTIFSQST